MSQFDIVLSKYQFNPTQMIGTGAYSRVFVGTDLESQQPVAIKVIEKQLFQDKVIYNQTMNEITCIKQLDHPNIVKYLDVIQTEQQLLIIMEFCDGGDLQNIIDRQTVVDQNEASLILKDINQGYIELIKHNIIHRDLKPANIFKKGDTWKIGDFGFALIIKKEINTPMIGTPLYMSPEVLQHHDYGYNSDVWSFCMVLYEIIHGYCAWNAENPQDLLKNIQTQGITFSDKILPEIKDFLTQGLTYDRQKRLNWEDMHSTELFEKIEKNIPYLQVQEMNQNKIDQVQYLSEIKFILITLQEKAPQFQKNCCAINYLICLHQYNILININSPMKKDLMANIEQYKSKLTYSPQMSQLSQLIKDLHLALSETKPDLPNEIKQEMLSIFSNYSLQVKDPDTLKKAANLYEKIVAL